MTSEDAAVKMKKLNQEGVVPNLARIPAARPRAMMENMICNLEVCCSDSRWGMTARSSDELNHFNSHHLIRCLALDLVA